MSPARGMVAIQQDAAADRRPKRRRRLSVKGVGWTWSVDRGKLDIDEAKQPGEGDR